MRIHVLTSLYPFPARPFEGIFAERRWRGMRARGHDVLLTHPMPYVPLVMRWGRYSEIASAPPQEWIEGIDVARPRYLHLPGQPLGNARRFARTGIRRIIGAGRPEVVVCDYAWPAGFASASLSDLGIPCVINGRGTDILGVSSEGGLAGPLARSLVAASGWCGVSLDIVQAMDGLAGGRGAGHLVPNGVDLERFCPRDRSDARRVLGMADGVPLVLVVGHLIDRKDPLLALDAFARGAPRDAHCVFLGQGPLAHRVQKRARELGIEQRVGLRGEVGPGDLATWYAASDLLLLTSRREGRPNVVLEALASGRPVVATRAGGTAEILGEESPMLVEVREVDQVSDHIAAILAEPPDPAQCRALVQDLSWEASLEALEGCLIEAVERGGR